MNLLTFNQLCPCGAPAVGISTLTRSPICRECHERLKAERLRRRRPADYPLRNTTGKRTHELRDRCNDCGVILAPGPMGSHQRFSGHYGRTEL